MPVNVDKSTCFDSSDAAIQNVTNFTCVIYNWDEIMNCSWSLGEYRFVNAIDVELYM